MKGGNILPAIVPAVFVGTAGRWWASVDVTLKKMTDGKGGYDFWGCLGWPECKETL